MTREYYALKRGTHQFYSVYSWNEDFKHSFNTIPLLLMTASEDSNNDKQRILIVRHGERMDITFNLDDQNWLQRTLTQNGRYKPVDLNMPRTLQRRSDGMWSYGTDPPLTELGYMQAKLIGRAMATTYDPPDVFYVSPALRCVHTALGLMKGMGPNGDKIKFNVEPGLFEWGHWFKPQLPPLMTTREMIKFKFPINQSYRNAVRLSDISIDESLASYYARSNALMRRIIDESKGRKIMIIGHGATLDTCTRQLLGFPARSQRDFTTVLQQTPYMAMVHVEAPLSANSSTQWSLIAPPVNHITHQANASWNPKSLWSWVPKGPERKGRESSRRGDATARGSRTLTKTNSNTSSKGNSGRMQGREGSARGIHGSLLMPTGGSKIGNIGSKVTKLRGKASKKPRK